MIHIAVCRNPEQASQAAARELTSWVTEARTLVVAGGNSPRQLYRLLAGLPMAPHLQVFTLDEYLGVPIDDPRTCSNLLRREVADAWHIPSARFHALSSRIEDAEAWIAEHERQLAECGGLDAVVLGLGRNGHLGFNEPGSSPHSPGRVVSLTPVSVTANAEWFNGEYAPAQGITLGLGTILAARRVLLVAFGTLKVDAVYGTVVAPPNEGCPGSWLQKHQAAYLYLDEAAAARLPSECYRRED